MAGYNRDVLQAAVASSLQLPHNWLVLARAVAQAEFPTFDLPSMFTIFSLSEDVNDDEICERTVTSGLTKVSCVLNLPLGNACHNS